MANHASWPSSQDALQITRVVRWSAVQVLVPRKHARTQVGAVGVYAHGSGKWQAGRRSH